MARIGTLVVLDGLGDFDADTLEVLVVSSHIERKGGTEERRVWDPAIRGGEIQVLARKGSVKRLARLLEKAERKARQLNAKEKWESTK